MAEQRQGSHHGGISVVVPTFNAATEIAATIERIRDELLEFGSPLEFIVVDDGSRDGSSDAAGRGGLDVRCIRELQNRGKGWAVYRGVLAARYDIVCFTDADGPFLFGSYRSVVQRVLEKGCFAIGSRRLSASQMLVKLEVLNYAARRHLVGLAFNWWLRQLLALPIRDTQCGLKAFPRSVGVELVQRIRSFGFLFDVELLLAARALGVRVEEVAVCVAYRERKTSLRLLRESVQMGSGLFRVAWRDRRGVYKRPNPVLQRLLEQDPAVVAAAAPGAATPPP